MADVHANADIAVRYNTTSHSYETLAERGPDVPHMMTWADLSPNLTVLPPGSGAAGEGEINWEDTLGGRFYHACEQLEGLLYAVYGSRPNYTDETQWYERPDPRCMWLAEIWKEIDCSSGGTGANFHYAIKQTAAHGEYHYDYPAPTVPIRSRSGDPSLQVIEAKHHGYFGAGVTRSGGEAGTALDHNGEPTYDPISTTVFPNSTDADENDIADEAEDVLITWTPVGIAPAAISSVTLKYWLNGTPGQTSMSWDAGDGRYEATLNAQAHGATLAWYIDLRLNSEPGTAIYEPLVETPSETNVYSFIWFSHYVRYPHGLPEAIDTYAGAQLRVSTDYHQFLPGDTIQYQLFNLMRFVLNHFGSSRLKQPFQHNPRVRSGDQACCIRQPITFRWTGGNTWPHYLTGGKGGGGLAIFPATLEVVPYHPLHDGSNEGPSSGDWGDLEARYSWRGMGLLFTGDLDNWSYAQGYSWEQMPDVHVLSFEESVLDPAAIAYTSVDAGLKEGDVIDAVHVEELIQAVEYLISYGVWVESDIYSKYRTTDSYLGATCGYDWERDWHNYNGATGTEVLEQMIYCWKCCSDCDGHEEWWYVDGDLEDYWYEPEGGPFCTPWTKPSWSTCWNDADHLKCKLNYTRTKICTCSYSGGNYSKTTNEYISVNCAASTSNNGGTGESIVWCDPESETDLFYVTIEENAQGWSAYFCSPPACQEGVDAYHGNLLKLRRYDHDCTSGGPHPVSTGNVSFGNCFGDIHGCHEEVEVIGHSDIWFEEVFGGKFNGLVGDTWIDVRDCEFPTGYCGCPTSTYEPLYPELEAVGLYEPEEYENPLCAVRHLGWSSPSIPGIPGSGASCAISWTANAVCNGSAIYVAANLNLDGSRTSATGRPYRRFPGRDGEYTTPYDGDGIPILLNYDLAIASPPSDDCPCETKENPTTCT